MEIRSLAKGGYFKLESNLYQKTDGVRWGQGAVEYCCVLVADGSQQWLREETLVEPIAVIITLPE